MTIDRRRTWLRLAALAILALPGCAFLQGQAAADSEEILAQAGFRRYPLDEPGLPSRQLVEAQGSYKFADPDFCRCVYTGDARQYAELQRLRAERIAERQWLQARMAAGTSFDDQVVWGAWNPEGLDVIKAPVAAGNVSTDTLQGSALH
jgi:hypothetical protein